MQTRQLRWVTIIGIATVLAGGCSKTDHSPGATAGAGGSTAGAAGGAGSGHLDSGSPDAAGDTARSVYISCYFNSVDDFGFVMHGESVSQPPGVSTSSCNTHYSYDNSGIRTGYSKTCSFSVAVSEFGTRTATEQLVDGPMDNCEGYRVTTLKVSITGVGDCCLGCNAVCPILPSGYTSDIRNCGNGILDPGEQCDDSNRTSGDGCNSLCQLEANWKCANPGQPCVPSSKCGDNVVTSNETCDDGNTIDGDGCSKDCHTVELGWQCRVPGQPCIPLCGDSQLAGSEQCDDGNAKGGDGCSSTCQIEPGCLCPVLGKPCTKAVCGNGTVEQDEQCDAGVDNGIFHGDGTGCSKTCTKEPSCSGSSGQACSTACGDGNVDAPEECDDGNLVDGDGCSKNCKQEGGFICTATPEDSSTCQTGSGPCVRTICAFRCGDGIVSVGEECDDGEYLGTSPQNDDNAYGGCTTKCTFGPYCGDGVVNGSEECDSGRSGSLAYGRDGCTAGCTKSHYCGDGIVDTDQGEVCDLGILNGVKFDVSGAPPDAADAMVRCNQCRSVGVP